MSRWRTPRHRMGLDLTPLIDVVFTLLIFVVVAARFDQTSARAVDLPGGAAGQARAEAAVVVTVDRTGQAFWEGRLLEGDPGSQLVRLTGSRPREVEVRADRSASYGAVFAVLDSMDRAGVASVGLAHVPGR